MKIEIISNQTNEHPPFPCLMVNNSFGTIYIAIGGGTAFYNGIILDPGNLNKQFSSTFCYKIGQIVNLDIEKSHPFIGKIKLEND